MKRKILSLVLVIAMILSLTGCGGDVHKDKLVLALRSGTYSEVIKACLADFEAEHGITCEVLELSEDDLHSHILNDTVSSSGAYDLCMVDGSWVAEFISEGVLADLGDLGYSFDDDIIPATTAICVQNGKTYLVPYYGNVTVMMYNKSVAADLGLAEDSFSSLTDLEKFCRQSELVGKGGFVYRGDTDNNIVVDFLPILRAFGGWVVDDNNRPSVNTPEFNDAMSFYKELTGTGGALTQDELIKAIESGRMVAAVGWPGWYSATDNVNMDYTAFPGKAAEGKTGYNANIYGIWTLGIPSNCTNKPLAAELLTYLMDKDVQKSTVQNGGVPCRYSSLNDPELVADNPHLPIICTALENGIYRPVISEWPRFYAILGNEMKRIMSNEVSVSDGLNVAQQELETMMSGK